MALAERCPATEGLTKVTRGLAVALLFCLNPRINWAQRPQHQNPDSNLNFYSDDLA